MNEEQMIQHINKTINFVMALAYKGNEFDSNILQENSWFASKDKLKMI